MAGVCLFDGDAWALISFGNSILSDKALVNLAGLTSIFYGYALSFDLLATYFSCFFGYFSLAGEICSWDLLLKLLTSSTFLSGDLAF